jgi:2-polyprenyl-6-methoxyphenol hydroxylase-like FAD-dependent oxidoreductase
MIPQRFQVVIIGGGSAGTAAAVASASQGMHTLLIEKNPYGGGNATAAEVGTICGLFHQNKQQEAEWLVKGYAKYFAERLDEAPLIHSTSNIYGVHFLPYRVEDFKNLVLEELHNAKVEVWWNATIRSISTEKNSLHRANIEKNGALVPIEFDAIIDCTGNASICEMIQHTMIQENEYQASARVFTIEGMDPGEEQVIQLIIWRALTKAIRNGILPGTFNLVYPVHGSFVN